MSSIFHKIKTAAGLSARQWLLLVQAWPVLLYIRLRMDLTPFKSWKSWLANAPDGGQGDLSSGQIESLVLTRNMVTLASRYHFINANCLPRSLTLKWLLARQGIDSELNMGLNLDNNEFHGHAWLVRDGRVLNDSANVSTRYPVKQEIGQRPLTG